MVELIGHNGAVLFSVSDLAREALEFIARTGAFYVRELPGGLTDDEKLALISTMVDARLLRVGRESCSRRPAAGLLRQAWP
jgi:hypothetical protein